jgi:hypothetical protein
MPLPQSLHRNLLDQECRLVSEGSIVNRSRSLGKQKSHPRVAANHHPQRVANEDFQSRARQQAVQGATPNRSLTVAALKKSDIVVSGL